MSLVVSPPNFPHQPFSDTDVSYPSTSSSQGSSTTAEQLITPPSPLAALHPFEERPKPLVPFPIFQQRHSSPFPVAQSFSVLGPPSNSSGPSPPPAPKLSTSALPALTPLATPTISEMIVQPTLPPTPDPSPPNSKVLFPDAMIKLAPPATVDHYGFTSIEEIVLGEERPKMMPTISIDPSSRPVSPQIEALTRARSHSHTQPIRPSLGEVAALTSPNVNRKSMGPPPKPMRRSQTAINPSTLRLAESRSESLEARVKGRNLVGMGARQPSSQLAVYNRSSSPGMTRTLTAPTLDSPSDSAVPDMGGPDGLEAKVVLLGSQGVGKTSLILRYTTRVFASTTAAATIGSSLHTRKLVHSGVRVKLQIWDTAGQERFRSMAPIYYRGAHVCVLVYDVSDRSSFDDVRSWLEELGRTVPKETVIYIVGSKIDLESPRVVWPEEAQETIRSWLKPAAPQPPAQTQSHLSPPSSHSRNLLRSSSLASQQPRTAPASILSSPTPTRSHSHTALTTLITAPSVPAPKAPLVKTSPVKTPAKETVPFPAAPRTRPSSMQITSPRPLSVTVDPTSPRSRKLSFPALQSPTLPTSVTFVEPIKPSLTPASPTSRHGVSAGRFSISGALGFSRTSSISGAASSLARLAEDNPVSPREGPYMPSERHFASKTSSTGRAQSFNSDTPQRARLQSSPALGMGMADANRRRSEDWSAGTNRPWRMGEGPGAAEALGEFGAGVRKKESGELLTTRSTKSTGGITSPSDRTKPTGRARGGSLGRDSRLYGSERGSSDGHEDDAGWGVDVEGMRVGEVSALSGEGVEALFRSVSALLVEKREKIERERTLRRKNSVMLTDPVESQNKDAKVKARGGCC